MSTRAQVGEQILGLMQELIAAAVLTNERIARAMGLNVVDTQTYGVLVRHGEPMTPGQLSQVTELPSSTTTRVLDRLEAKGLVRREPDPTDRRRSWVHAVGTLHPEAAASYASIGEQMGRIHADFSVAELEVVARYLDAVKDVR